MTAITGDMAKAMSTDCASIRARLDLLPQELYDEIYDLTFTSDDDCINLGTTYMRHLGPKPATGSHKMLAISRESRAIFAKRYYADTTFVVYDIPTSLQWLASLPVHHQRHIHDVRCVAVRGELHAEESVRKGAIDLLSASGREFLMGRGISTEIAAKVKFGYENILTDDIARFRRCDQDVNVGVNHEDGANGN